MPPDLGSFEVTPLPASTRSQPSLALMNSSVPCAPIELPDGTEPPCFQVWPPSEVIITTRWSALTGLVPVATIAHPIEPSRVQPPPPPLVWLATEGPLAWVQV